MQKSIVYSKIQVVTHHYEIFLCSQYIILASHTSSSSTKVSICPHTKNDSYSHRRINQLRSGIKCNAHTLKDKHNACFHPSVCPYFPIDLRFRSLKIKKVFIRLEMGISSKVWSFSLSDVFSSDVLLSRHFFLVHSCLFD